MYCFGTYGLFFISLMRYFSAYGLFFISLMSCIGTSNPYFMIASYNIVSGTNILYNRMRTMSISIEINMMLVTLPLVNVMKWAISGEVFTSKMPPNSWIC